MANTETTKSLQCLWVDDEPQYLAEIVKKVESKINVIFDYAQTISVALKKLSSKRYDVVLLDLVIISGRKPDVNELVALNIDKYHRHQGLALLKSLLTDASSITGGKISNTIPIIVISSFLIDALSAEEKFSLDSEKNVSFIAKYDLYSEPDILVAPLRQISNADILTKIKIESEKDIEFVRSKNFRVTQVTSQFPKMFSRILHAHHQGLRGLSTVVNDSINLLIQKITDTDRPKTSDEAEFLVRKTVSKLLHDLEDLHKPIITELDQRGIATNTWDELSGCIFDLESYLAGSSVIQNPNIHQIIIWVKSNIEQLSGRVQKSNLRNIRNSVEEAEVALVIYDLVYAQNRVAEMERTARTFSSYISASIQPQSSFEELSVYKIVERVTASLKKYANTRNMRLKLSIDERCKSYYSSIVEKDLTRAIDNIISNAILHGSQGTDINIKIFEDTDKLCIRIENKGTPITKDEIASGLLFQEGYVGKYSRTGHEKAGLGLSDASRVIQQHTGTIKISSKSVLDNQAETFDTEFVTSVLIKLDIIDKGSPAVTFEIQEVVNAAIENMQRYAANENIKLQPKGFNRWGQVKITAIRQDILTVFENIIDNAIKYTDYLSGVNEPWVEIELSSKPGYVDVAIESWGTPIAKDEISTGRIFEEGVRGRYAPQGRREGQGIGLYEAMRLVTKHSGAITVNSRPARENQDDDYSGRYITTFTVTLPVSVS